MLRDIDAALEKTKLELKIDGEIYTVKDVSVREYLAAVSEGQTPEGMLKLFSRVIGIDEEKARDFGFLTISLVLREVTSWMESLQKGEEGESVQDPTP